MTTPASGARTRPASSHRRTSRLSLAIFGGFVLLSLTFLAVRAALPLSATGSFLATPDGIPTGQAGSSSLQTSDGNSAAQVEMWTAQDTPTYFFPVAIFQVQASSLSGSGSVEGTLGVSFGLQGIPSNLSEGQEVYALVLPYEGADSATLATTPMVPGGFLQAPVLAPSSSSPFAAFEAGFDADAQGETPIGDTSSLTFHLAPGSQADLAIYVGADLGGEAGASEEFSFTITFTLTVSPS